MIKSLTFIQGLLIGITMAAPIGPISILCIRRSISKGHHAGLATALGVALADGFYAVVAAFGLTAISSFLINQKEYLYLGGGILFLFLGYKAFTSPPIDIAQPIKTKGFITTAIQTMLITLTNPMTIVIFIAAFAALGFVPSQHTWFQAFSLCLGVFFGSLLWYLMLSTIVAHLRTKMTPYFLTFINKISGILLTGAGIFFILNALKKYIYAFA